jgi:hypothetical protein
MTHDRRLRLEKTITSKALYFLEVQTDILSHFRIQVEVSLLQSPHGSLRIRSEAAVKCL